VRMKKSDREDGNGVVVVVLVFVLFWVDVVGLLMWWLNKLSKLFFFVVVCCWFLVVCEDEGEGEEVGREECLIEGGMKDEGLSGGRDLQRREGREGGVEGRVKEAGEGELELAVGKAAFVTTFAVTRAPVLADLRFVQLVGLRTCSLAHHRRLWA